MSHSDLEFRGPVVSFQGLDAVNGAMEQAAFIVTDPPAPGFEHVPTGEEKFTRLSSPVRLDGRTETGSLAIHIPAAAWSHFGNWGGMEVSGMLSWAFLKDGQWTLDFENRRMWTQ